jgi:hypothetical protein
LSFRSAFASIWRMRSRVTAVGETVATAREFNKPYAVVINAAPVKRKDQEASAVALSRAQFERLSVPVWSGQIFKDTCISPARSP